MGRSSEACDPCAGFHGAQWKVPSRQHYISEVNMDQNCLTSVDCTSPKYWQVTVSSMFRGKPAVLHHGLVQTHRKSRRQLKHTSHVGMILDTTSYFIPPRGVHHLNIVDRSVYDMSIATGHTRAVVDNPPTERNQTGILREGLNETFSYEGKRRRDG
jgi:hypothetical protein